MVNVLLLVNIPVLIVKLVGQTHVFNVSQDTNTILIIILVKPIYHVTMIQHANFVRGNISLTTEPAQLVMWIHLVRNVLLLTQLSVPNVKLDTTCLLEVARHALVIVHIVHQVPTVIAVRMATLWTRF